jgi:hypothetical protein
MRFIAAIIGSGVGALDRLERGALDAVAGVEQQHRLALGAHALDQGRDAREAARRRPIGQVVVGRDRAVQVGGVEDREADFLGAPRGRGDRQQRGEEREQRERAGRHARRGTLAPRGKCGQTSSCRRPPACLYCRATFRRGPTRRSNPRTS